MMVMSRWKQSGHFVFITHKASKQEVLKADVKIEKYK